MSSRLHNGEAAPEERPSKGTASRTPVVSLSDARRAQNPSRAAGTPASTESRYAELEEARALIDRGLPSAAESRLRQLVSAARRDPRLLALARRMLSSALEILGRYDESLEAVAVYDSAEARKPLDSETLTSVRVQLGLACNYTGDQPKAVALLQTELRETAERGGSDAQLGEIYAALSRVYRSINEFPISRDHAHKALEHYRRAGDWRGLAECYFGLAMADVLEGLYERSVENFEQAVGLVADRPAPYLLGKIYNNMAGAYCFMKRPHDGIRALEKAVALHERTEHKEAAATGYNNLGNNLVLIGQWDRAQVAYKRALELALEIDHHGTHASMIFDSLGELRMFRGELDEARVLLERGLAAATEGGKSWYVVQAMRTLSRCYIAMGLTDEALRMAERALERAEKIGDRQALCESRLLLAEARLQGGDAAACAALLQTVSEEVDSESVTDLSIAGEAQRVHGLLALERGDGALAAHHFGRCLSICEMTSDRYRTARAHYLLARASVAASQPERAAEHAGLAAHAFRELGARLDFKRAEELLAAFDGVAPAEVRREPPAPAQLLTLRLAEAVASRELLLRELAAVIHQETRATRVLIAEEGDDGHTRVVVAHGCDAEEAGRLAALMDAVGDDAAREQFAASEDARVVVLRSSSAKPATLFVSPHAQSVLTGGSPLEPLLRVVELGMDVCALRTRARAGRDALEHDSLAGASLMPGFIHSSPAMTRLVDEVHKIRSSDVTVLVTGESGTGKELVARAIHALSSRRTKVFIPFNCTAVPKELSEGYLFGYRRGAFTGAVHDSPGVIRTAAGGTLFLDEVGDLPLDVQPKLLRFLQEGEIQPLGEQRPQKVDVRIIAATNTDLEAMVADGRFREDLYYRLNVIRLRVPPLRERRSEIPTIVNYYINHYSAKFGRSDISITPQTLDLLMVCDWPGNVRQLTNEIQRIVARAEDGTVITPDHISPELRRVAPSAPAPSAQVFGQPAGLASAAADAAISQGLTLADATAELERRMIAEAMRRHNGNISRAARELGLTRRGLYLKLGRHDLSASA
ncbi:MAG TPA: sigma 54-interacting transcriptional regulator [Pyrinomonadaceae bacterium]|nr:sigma 54-interacting transcriptional regulator [Pyrinomonadaceae bacterium]